VELDSEQGGGQDGQKMVARDVLDQVGQEDHVLWEAVEDQDKKDAMIDMVGDVDDGLEKITAMSSTKAGWAKTVGKLVEDVEQGVDYVITLDLVEDVLICVILATGDEEAGWGETAGKLAET